MVRVAGGANNKTLARLPVSRSPCKISSRPAWPFDATIASASGLRFGSQKCDVSLGAVRRRGPQCAWAVKAAHNLLQLSREFLKNHAIEVT
jgi:hypothetical protein